MRRATSRMLFLVLAALVACGGGRGDGDSGNIQPLPPVEGSDTTTPPSPPAGGPAPTPSTPAPQPLPPVPSFGEAAPILFVTQVPVFGDSFEKISGNFANHLPEVAAAPRGGDLWIAYPNADGTRTLRNLTADAGLGNDIAARDPSPHWDGTKALVSLVVGSGSGARWQVYEVSGLGRREQVAVKRLNQPAEFNNISAVYDSNDRIVMVSDMPRGGPGAEHRHLYPQLDEYDEARTNTGLWRLDATNGGSVTLLDHAPSGDFRPHIDSYGRLLFTRWDHLQRDQQSGDPQHGLFNWPDESNGPRDPGPDTGPQTRITEVFPERFGKGVRDGVHDHTFNFFLPWMARQDGTGLETHNHIGRHELGLFAFAKFANEQGPQFGLGDLVGARGVNADLVNAGVKLDAFHYLREDPLHPGTYYAVRSQEFGTHGGGCIMTFLGEPSRRPQDMKVTLVTPAQTCGVGGDALYRSPLPTGDGRLLASVSTVTYLSKSGTPPSAQPYNFRLSFLKKQGAQFVPDALGKVTPGDGLKKTLKGTVVAMWEWDAVELRARVRPEFTTMDPIEAAEQSIFADPTLGVGFDEFEKFLKDNRLALIVSRNVTLRDGFDHQQPFNLRVPGGTQGTAPNSNAPVFTVDNLQLFQAMQLRGIKNDESRGRRVLAQPMTPVLVGGKNVNPMASPNAPAGSVRIAPDGSMAALVPADRALTWQLVNSAAPGDAKKGTDGVVNERFWLSFRPGEVRVCASCHGVSDKDQAGGLHDTITNTPQALRDLVDHYRKTFAPKGTGAKVGWTRAP